jgi:hypothetical protein
MLNVARNIIFMVNILVKTTSKRLSLHIVKVTPYVHGVYKAASFALCE